MAKSLYQERYQTFRELLVEARLSKKLLQKELGEQIGRNQAFVSKFERGERDLNFLEFLEIADVLEINVQEFIKKLDECFVWDDSSPPVKISGNKIRRK